MIPAGQTTHCIVCLAALTYDEWNYYEYRCEKCERSHFQRIQRWKAGGEDRELDELFAAKDSE